MLFTLFQMQGILKETDHRMLHDMLKDFKVVICTKHWKRIESPTKKRWVLNLILKNSKQILNVCLVATVQVCRLLVYTLAKLRWGWEERRVRADELLAKLRDAKARCESFTEIPMMWPDLIRLYTKQCEMWNWNTDLWVDGSVMFCDLVHVLCSCSFKKVQ